MKSDSMFKLVQRGAIQYLEADILSNCEFISHAFLTRWGGISEGRFADLNFSVREGDTPEHVNHNYQIISKNFNVPNFFFMQQIHGDRVIILQDRDETATESIPQADAVITTVPLLGIGIKTADCVPILLVDRIRKIIGAVHAGWRSTALQIAAKTVAAFESNFSSRPADLVAVIGPCIGPCCYEVDQIVYDAMNEEGREQAFKISGQEKWKLDLAMLNKQQLIKSGLNPELIVAAERCTACQTDLFFSHRGENGKTGRQFNFIALKDPNGYCR